MKTTDEWEALLDGTKPGPWVIGATLKDPLVDVSAGTYEDARLAAHAPAAVAELVRLRTALEDLRHYLAEPWRSQTIYEEGLQMGYAYVADHLTRILEGDTDEL